jgi:hypothetical protein
MDDFFERIGNLFVALLAMFIAVGMLGGFIGFLEGLFE